MLLVGVAIHRQSANPQLARIINVAVQSISSLSTRPARLGLKEAMGLRDQQMSNLGYLVDRDKRYSKTLSAGYLEEQERE